MDTEYFNELKETAADVKAVLTHHMDAYGRPIDTVTERCLDAVASVSVIADRMVHQIKYRNLPQCADDLYDALIDAAVDCIVAANKVRHG